MLKRQIKLLLNYINGKITPACDVSWRDIHRIELVIRDWLDSLRPNRRPTKLKSFLRSTASEACDKVNKTSAIFS